MYTYNYICIHTSTRRIWMCVYIIIHIIMYTYTVYDTGHAIANSSFRRDQKPGAKHLNHTLNLFSF